jgi:YedE family putative selenium metabolism protein
MKIAKNRAGVLVTGLVIGAAGILLTALGNPANMGICAACFLRDTAGALGLDGAAPVQYLRPEIPGFILGAFLFALLFKNWKVSRASSPLVRFVIAFFVMFGCLVFLGCPLRMALRLGAGDLNALVALAGFMAGIYAGSLWLKGGFSLGAEKEFDQPRGLANGLVIPALGVLLLVFLLLRPAFIKFSEQGPGSQHAPVLLALAAALVIGLLCGTSGFCITGGFRDLFLIKKAWGFAGYLAIIAAALVGSLVTGTFRLGFEGQPIAHPEALWNFLGMALAGYGSVLIDGCPLRQLIKAGLGSTNAGIAILAYLAAGATAHNFGIAASATGVPLNGKIAVIAGLAVVSLFAALCRKRA